MKADHQVQTIVEGIISYLQEKKSLDLLPEIARSLIKQSWVRFDPNLATVSSPVKLDQKQLKKIKAVLSTKMNRKIRLKAIIDKSIIAGFRINIAGQVIDGTINKKLIDLQQKVIYD